MNHFLELTFLPNICKRQFSNISLWGKGRHPPRLYLNWTAAWHWCLCICLLCLCHITLSAFHDEKPSFSPTHSRCLPCWNIFMHIIHPCCSISCHAQLNGTLKVPSTDLPTSKMIFESRVSAEKSNPKTVTALRLILDVDLGVLKILRVDLQKHIGLTPWPPGSSHYSNIRDLQHAC